MKKLNSEELFNLFSIGDEEVYIEHGVEDILHNSYILFGMVVKGVENYFIMEQMYQSRYGESFASVKDSIKLKYFTGLIRYLERIDLSHSDTLFELKDIFQEQPIEYALKEMINLFERVERYEECALIMKFYTLFFPKNIWKSEN